MLMLVLAIAIVVVVAIAVLPRSTAHAAQRALAAARGSMPELEPDGWAGDRPYLSAALVDTAAAQHLARHGIEVDMVDAELVQVGIATVARARFVWRRGSWRSSESRIDVMLDIELPITGRTTAALTTARKIFLRSLLGIRQAPDPEGAMNRAADAARISVRESTRRLLRAYAAKSRRAESAILRMALPSRAKQVDTPTFEGLQQVEIAGLAWWLLTQVGDASTFVEGELPAGTFERPSEEMPTWMEG